MALCVTLQSDGTLVPTGQPVAECSGYVLTSAAEYGVYGVVQRAFEFPDAETALTWFSGTLGLILFLYTAMRMAGALANVFNDSRS